MVSLPSWELFDEQSQGYRDEVIPPAVEARVCVEAGRHAGLGPVRRPSAARSSRIDRFGASAPGPTVLDHLGFTPRHVADEALRVLSRHPRRGHHAMTRLHDLAAAGTSPWLDNIRRSWLELGHVPAVG